MRSDLLNTDNALSLMILVATIAFVVSFTVSVGVGLYFFRKYPTAKAETKEKRTTEVVTTFFMIMTSVYTGVGTALDRLDPIILSFFVAGVFGNVVGSKSVEAIQKGTKK